MRELGVAQAVYEKDLGAGLAVDVAAAATTVYVNDVAYFNPNGGAFKITDGTNTETLPTYSGIDEATGALTGVDGLANSYDADDTRVELYPTITVRYAEVALDGQRDTVRARVPFSMFDRLQVAFRDASADETQRVEIELQDDEYVVTDVLGEAPSLDVDTLTVVEDLSVEGTLTLEGDSAATMVVERAAYITLDGQQSNPQSAPTISQGWDSVDLSAEIGANDEVTALYYDPTLTHFFVSVFTFDGDAMMHEYDNTWTLVASRDLSALAGGSIIGPYGMARAGGKFYVLGFTSETGTPLRFIRFDTSWNYEAVHSASDWNGVTTPRLNGDGTDIHFNDTNLTPISGNMKQVFRRYTSAGAAPSLASSMTTDDIYDQPRGFAGRGSFDFGALRWVASPLHENYVRAWNTSSAEQTNEKFRWGGYNEVGTEGCEAVCWDGTRFWSIPTEDQQTVYKHSTIEWTTESSTFWVAYTWYDSDATGSTHESAMSPKLSYTHSQRKKVTWNTATIPDGGGTDDPTAVRVYFGRGSTEPAYTAMYRQATGADGETTGDLDAIAFSGTAAPSESDFPGGDDAGQIRAGDPTLYATIRGDGDGFLPIGAVQMFAGASAPTGWLLCNGAAVSRTTYANLYAIIGDAHGAGDGSTTFNLPDLRSRFPIGAGTFAALGADDGLTEANRTPRHDHGAGTLATADHNSASNTTTGGGGTRTTTVSHNITGRTGTSAATEIAYYGINFIIKT